MRLTLRTLLAYLDDTLEPSEIKEIGQKVAESDAAQELVARIKQTTRRRRLTTPPATGPGARFDANTVAEYLDNELSSDLVAELEKTCLESDVHLAEVASCHQILTLVLGEPALVPPTARERMYGLVKGREAIPFRKARLKAGAAAEDLEHDADAALLPGMLSSRGWLLWVLPLAVVLILAALAVALWPALSDTRPPLHVAQNTPPTDSSRSTPVLPVDTSAKDKEPEKPVPPITPPVEPTPPTPPVEPPPPTPPLDARPNPPSKVRAVVGRYEIPPRTYSILVQRQAEQPGWKRLTGASEVSSNDDLVSLPGYNSELSLGKDGGAHLLLHGHVPEFTVHPFENMDFLLESAVRLHQPEGDFDVDLTLNRGRFYLSSRRPNGPVKVRLRFGGDPAHSVPGEVWDLTLVEAGTEIGLDLLQGYTSDINYRDGEAPLQEVYLTLLTGRAGVKINYHEYPNLPAPAVLHWDNKSKGASDPQPIPPQVLPQVRTLWDKGQLPGATPQEKDSIARMSEAVESLSKLMTDKQAPEAALLEARQKDDSPAMLRLLAVYSFGAVDAADKLLDVLCTDEAAAHGADRNAAIFTLRRWIAHDAANGKKLYDEKTSTGLLMKYFKRSGDAENTLQLLHDFPAEDAAKTATFELLTTYMGHEKLAVRELAYWHLMRLSQGVRVPLPPYNAADDADKREPAVAAWKQLVKKGDLPPRPQN